MIMEIKKQWTEEFPTEPGFYWFYGYLYGHKFGPEFALIEVLKASNNNMAYIAHGKIVYKKDVVLPHFQKADLPELPVLEW